FEPLNQLIKVDVFAWNGRPGELWASASGQCSRHNKQNQEHELGINGKGHHLSPFAHKKPVNN
ncbi:MAG: hypothetical protein VCF08_23810, partial [Alphaproteobacteria bacterium]